MKRLIAFLLCIFTVVCSVNFAMAQEKEIDVILDGKTLSFDVPPMIINSRTMVPLRAIFEAMGMEIEWDPTLYKITAKGEKSEIVMTVGDSTAYVNGEAQTLDSPPVIVDSRTLVPVRFISESVGAEVKWDDVSRTVDIYTGNRFKDYIFYRDSLRNTYTKLTQDKSLRILYYGGSVTAGTGATNMNVYSWRAKTTKWFRESFPDAEITEINKTIGETGTFLGVYRLGPDLIEQNPDLVFIEYAINDTYGGFNKATAQRQFETIVRETRLAHPECDIVCVISIDTTRAQHKDFFYPTAAGHAEICEAYDIPLVYVGRALTDTIDPEDYNAMSQVWLKYFTDIVHPTNAGYAFYFDVMKEYLENALVKNVPENTIVAHTVPEVQSDYLMNGNVKVEFATEELLRGNDGWTYVPNEHVNNGIYNKGSIKAEITEDMQPFSYTFEGTELLLVTNLKNSDMYELNIDGEVTVKRAFNSDKNPKLIIGKLKPGTHTVTVKPIKSSSTHMHISVVYTRDASKQSVEGDK